MIRFLGVDGGGTGCRAAVADAAGLILGQGRAGPANVATDRQQAVENILSASHAALADAGLDASHLPHLIAGLGLAGANAAGAPSWLTAQLPFARMQVETDATTAVYGALHAGNGIVAALGTGSVFASQRSGIIRHIGGWGLTLGDEGSGARLGRDLLSESLRAVDGFRPMTPLLAQVLAEYGGPAGIVTFATQAPPAEFALLAPRLLSSDDPAALALLERQTALVAASIDLLQADDPVPVTFIGGLGPAYAARLQARWLIRPALGTPLDGALLLARKAA